MVFVTGGTGYLGRPLVERLVARGHRVRMLVRVGSEGKTPAGVEIARGYDLTGVRTMVHLIGVPRPAPWKGELFRTVDLPMALEAMERARRARVSHFVYVSVAQPAPVMRAYIDVRRQCEQALGASGLAYTILRPWYVLGPGHLWPHALRPLYALAERVPTWREGARRLGLVRREEMLRALVWAVENAPERGRVLDVPTIRALGAR
ncbi:MAG: NAD(P)H-binding protein [Acidobacteria bacterium]|nr:NAD(P)H-binding protein [Acidobacteriota bacterium]